MADLNQNKVNPLKNKPVQKDFQTEKKRDERDMKQLDEAKDWHH